MIFVDTWVWITLFRATNSRMVVHLRDLLDAELVALAAPVRVELTAGVSRRDRATLERLLSALPVVYRAAGQGDGAEGRRRLVR